MTEQEATEFAVFPCNVTFHVYYNPNERRYYGHFRLHHKDKPGMYLALIQHQTLDAVERERITKAEIAEFQKNFALSET